MTSNIECPGVKKGPPSFEAAIAAGGFVCLKVFNFVKPLGPQQLVDILLQVQEFRI